MGYIGEGAAVDNGRDYFPMSAPDWVPEHPLSNTVMAPVPRISLA